MVFNSNIQISDIKVKKQCYVSKIVINRKLFLDLRKRAYNWEAL